METQSLKRLVETAMEDLKAQDVTVLDVIGMTSVTDCMIIASGTSNRHVKAIANSVVMSAKEAGEQPLGVEGDTVGEWVLIDLGDVVCHVMQTDIREHYQLEKLWEADPAPQAAAEH
jgi:ribosome-associated protein